MFHGGTGASPENAVLGAFRQYALAWMGSILILSAWVPNTVLALEPATRAEEQQFRTSCHPRMVHLLSAGKVGDGERNTARFDHPPSLLPIAEDRSYQSSGYFQRDRFHPSAQ